MTVVPALLPAGSFAVGVVPGFAAGVARAVSVAGSAGVRTSPHWTPAGVLLGLTSTVLAAGLAAIAVRRPLTLAQRPWMESLRRLQSGHIGDYVAWLVAGAAPRGALALPGVFSG